MSHEIFLRGKVQLCCGDSLHFLKDQPDNRYDSTVTDPPYALVSIGKRFGADGAAAVKVPEGGSGAYARASAGFMGKRWDTGETAFAIEFWRECLRVLKPGGHVVAFGGTRTYHRLACAIEDAGFEIRDQLQWIYGSGFPKSHDVSKGIDKANGKHERDLVPFGAYVRKLRETRGWTLRQLDDAMETNTAASWWEGRKAGVQPPGLAQYHKLKSVLGMDNRFDGLIEWLEAEREVIGTKAAVPGVAFSSVGPSELDITAPATPQAAEWEGWGTALKPACEPICLARKPLSEKTVAANVLKWGTGAINVGACRVSASASRDNLDNNKACTCQKNEDVQTSSISDNGNQPSSSFLPQQQNGRSSNDRLNDRPEKQVQDFPDDCHLFDDFYDEHIHLGPVHDQDVFASPRGVHKFRVPDTSNANNHDYPSKPCPIHGPVNIKTQEATGRWPANIIHDGSDEVIAAFPESGGGGKPHARGGQGFHNCLGRDDRERRDGDTMSGIADEGSAARFFYTAKADADDRLGSKHPTVKPVDLMQWLVRLVTPKNGLCLDPFAGTGTTAEACYREGMRCMLVEREAEYQADIRRRMALVLGGPEERRRESIKAKTKDQPVDHGPLFSLALDSQTS